MGGCEDNSLIFSGWCRLFQVILGELPHPLCIFLAASLKGLAATMQLLIFVAMLSAYILIFKISRFLNSVPYSNFKTFLDLVSSLNTVNDR